MSLRLNINSDILSLLLLFGVKGHIHAMTRLASSSKMTWNGRETTDVQASVSADELKKGCIVFFERVLVSKFSLKVINYCFINRMLNSSIVICVKKSFVFFSEFCLLKRLIESSHCLGSNVT